MDYDIENLHKAALTFLVDRGSTKQYIDCMSYATYIREIRTITLGVPRQSGKTKYMLELKDKLSSVMFVPNQMMVDYCCNGKYGSSSTSDRSNIITFDSISSITRHIRGTNRFGLKYSVFIIDEYSYMKPHHEDQLAMVLSELKVQDMLTDDFYVLRIGTPTF